MSFLCIFIQDKTYVTMKKIMTLLATILFVSACVDFHEAIKQEAKQEIVFSSGCYQIKRQPSTRAIVEGTTFPASYHFGVYGYVNTSSNVEAASGRYLMKDAEYLSDGTPASGTYYWPADSDDITANFTAYAPSTLTHSWANDVLTISLDCSNMNDNCVDVLIANKSNVSPALNSSTTADDKTIRKDVVELSFTHALSYLEFQARHEDNSAIKAVTITDISYSSDLYTTGTLTLNTGASFSASVSGLGDAVTFDFSDDEALTASYRTLSKMLIIPQDVPTSITITYDITLQNEGGDRIVYKNRQVTRTINTGNDANGTAYVPKYLPGSKYTYRINITVDEVEFEIDVVDWTNDDTYWQIWDHDNTTAYVERFFEKASMPMGLSSLIA